MSRALSWRPCAVCVLAFAACAPPEVEGDSDVLWDALSALTFTPVADAEVQAGAPDRNFGASLELGADQSPARQAYLRFDLTGLSRPVKRAQLRCYALNGSVNGPNVYGAGNGWAESTLTYRNRPATGARLAGSVVVAYKQWLAADVTAAITGNGALTLALIADSTDSVICSSREGTAALRPQLVVELQAAPAVDAGTPPPPVVDAGTPPPPPPATGISCPAGSSEVFRDDFTGTSLDTSRWSVIEQNNGGGTFTQLTKMRAANVTVTGGRLHVASRRHCVDPYGNSAAAEHPDTCAGTNYYSGGWIKTKTAYAAGKGLMVFHAKMPAPVRGMFPALWARNEHGDQYYGELDLIETWWDVGKGTAADPNVYSSTTHMGAGAAVHTSNNQVGPFANLPSRFHVWEVEWDSTVSPAVARYYYRDAPGAARVLTRTVTSSSPGFAGKIPEQQFATALTDAWRPYVDFAVQPDSVWHVGPDSAATYDPEDLEVESVIVCR